MKLSTRPHRKKRVSWWRERFVTVMVIPERTRRIHKMIVPSFILKLSIVLVSLTAVFLAIMAFDYVHVLGQIAENKALKGENFKLQQELQLIRNKVDSVENTLDRVRNYAKKLQILTGHGQGKGPKKAPNFLFKDEGSGRIPAGVEEGHSQLLQKGGKRLGALPTGELVSRVEWIQKVGVNTEVGLSRLQGQLMARQAILRATPSLFPVDGWISSGFGYRLHPALGVQRMHRGIDIIADTGSPIRAPADGRVFFSGYRRGYGKVVVIDHGFGIKTLYAHGSRLFVRTGDTVKRGDTLASVGSTGLTTGPHLHFEIRKDGKAINPVPFFATVGY